MSNQKRRPPERPLRPLERPPPPNPPPPPPPPPPGGRGQQPQGPQRPDQNGRRPLGSGWPRWMIPVLLAAVVLFVAVPRVWPSEAGDKITYSEFISRVNAGDVKSVSIDKGSGTINGTTVDGGKFTATGAGERVRPVPPHP